MIPDIAAMASPGERAESRKKGESNRSDTGTMTEGLRGMKVLGSRDLTYRLAFLANSVKVIHFASKLNPLSECVKVIRFYSIYS